MATGDQIFKTAAFDAGASDITVVAAAGAGVIIQVHGYVVTVDTANGTVRWEDGTGGTALSGQMNMLVDQTLVCPFSEVAWFKTSANTLLNLEAAATGASGHIIYSEAR